MGFLVLAILSSSMISIMMRIGSDRASGKMSMLAANYLACSLLGAAYAGFRLAAPQEAGFSVILWLGLISGVLYLAGLVAFQRNTGKHGIVLSSVFMKLGLLVPIVISVVFFKEMPTASQIAGFCIAIFAILLINLKKGDAHKGFGFGLIAMLLFSGGADAMAKIFDMSAPQSLSALYLFYTFGTAFLLCLVLVVRGKERPGFRELLYGTLIGVPNFFAAKFLLAALTKLPAVVVYPSFSVGTMLLVTLTGVAVFRERLSKVQWIALAAILGALVLLNI
jgi:drug/metabolite transporter (DMT)-like permease